MNVINEDLINMNMQRAMNTEEEFDIDALLCIAALFLLVVVVASLHIDIYGIIFNGIDMINHMFKAITNFILGLASYMRLDTMAEQVRQLF